MDGHIALRVDELGIEFNRNAMKKFYAYSILIFLVWPLLSQPVLQSTTPGDGSTVAPIFNYDVHSQSYVISALVLTFDRPVELASSAPALLTVHRASDGGVVRTVSTFTTDVESSGNSLVIPISHEVLDAGESYYVLIGNGLIVESGNPSNVFSGFSETSDWTFTIRDNDEDGPSIMSLSPESGTTQAPLIVYPELTFDEVVFYKSGNGYTRIDGNAYDQFVTYSNGHKTISLESSSPINLTRETEYEVTMEKGTIFDIDGNEFNISEGEWVFTTYGPLSIESIYPPIGGTDIPLDDDFTITFNNDIDVDRFNETQWVGLYYTNNTNLVDFIYFLSEDVTISGNQITFNFDDLPLPGAWYYVEIPNGIIRDDFNQTIDLGSAAWNFYATENASSEPELASPADQTTDVSISPTLSWNTYPDATHYTLQIRISGDNDPIHQGTNISGTSYDIADEIGETLQYTTTYLWRVMAHDADGDSPWSAEWAFTTEDPVLPAPQLIAPADEAENISVTPSLSWNAVADADEYTVWLSADGDPFAIIPNISGTSTIVSQGLLDFYDEYEWTVVAHNEEGDSPIPGEVRTFRTVGPTTLVSPEDASTSVAVTNTFTWQPVAGAEKYTLGILDVDQEEMVEYEDITGTSYEVSGLDYATEYEWTVKTHNGDFDNSMISDGPNTPIWGFMTESEPIVHIPDDNFKSYLINNTSINTNEDQEIQMSEAAGFSGTINVYGSDISDLTGIEAFTAITGLNCLDNDLTSIDISQNIALEQLNVGFNQLEALNVSSNVNLTYLGAYVNNIMSLDVSQNTALTTLEIYDNMLSTIDVSQNVNLEVLEVQENQLTSLDVSQNPVLEALYCDNNEITSLDLSQSSGLYEIYCHDNLLTELNVANGNNSEGYIDATNNPELTCIQVDDADDSNLNSWSVDAGAGFSEDCSVPVDNIAPTVETFSYRYDTDVPIDIGQLTITFSEPVVTTTSTNIILRDYSNNIIVQHYYGVGLEGVSIVDEVVTFTIPQLTYGESYYVQIVSNSFQDLAGIPYAGIHGAQHWNFTAESEEEPIVQINDEAFKTFLLNNGQINTNSDQEIQVSEAENYTGNITYSNQGLSDPTGLEAFINTVWIDLSLNDLTSIDLSANVDANQVNLIGNDLESLVLPNRTSFNNILLNGNQLTSLTIPEGISVNTLQIYQNPLVTFVARNSTFDVINASGMSTMSSANLEGTNVRNLLVGSSQISELNVSAASSLESINVLGCTQLTSLDLSSNSNLSIVTTSFSGVQSLDLSNNTNITSVAARNGQLTSLNIQNGTNTNITTFQIQNNSNLECVQVDDVDYSTSQWTSKDVATQYSTDCDAQPEDQTITFEPIGSKVYGDDPFMLEASASSGLAVTFSYVSGPVSLDGNEVTITGAGTAVIAANQAGDDDFNPAPEEQQSFEIARADQVITIEPIVDKLTTDATFDVVASVDSELSLSYGVSGPATNDGAEITLTGETGTVTVTVSQSGNSNYNEASEYVSFEVTDPEKTNQSISFETIGDKTFGEDPFTIEASATSGLTVTFSYVSGPVSLDGNEVTITGAGTAVIAANQAGDDNFNPAPEEQQSFEIDKADQVITIEPIADKLTSDAPFNVMASVDSELSLTYEVSGPATNDGAEITLSGETGMVTVTVSQAGNDNYNEASESVSFDVTDPSKTNQTISFETIENRTFGDDPFNLEASATSGLTVAFSYVSGPVSLDGNEVTITGAGTAVIAAHQVGDNDFNPAPEEQQSFEIAKADQVITIEPIADKLTTDAAFNVMASVDSELSLTYEVSGPATNDGAEITLSGETGTVTVTVGQAGNDNYNEASESVSFDVTDPSKTNQTISFETIENKTFGDATFTLAASATSGLAVTFSYVSGPVSLDGNEVTITGAGTAVIAANQAGDDDFNPAPEEEQSFEIAKADQQIVINPIPDKVVNDASFEVNAEVSSGLDLSYEIAGPGSISGTTITLDGTAGTITVSVRQPGNENYHEALESITFEVMEEITVGLSDKEMNVKVYPNPVVDYLILEGNGDIEVRLIDLQGTVVRSLNDGDNRINMSDLGSGIYLLEARSKEGFMRKKIIKD